MNVKLLVVGGRNDGKRLQVEGDKFLIGRHESCQLRPSSPEVSRQHCAIITKEGRVYVRDLKSRTGTFVNDERVEKYVEVKNGDKLRIGPLNFEIELSVDVGGKKKPKVKSVQEAAARTVEAAGGGGEDEDIFGLLGENPEETSAPIPGLRTTEQAKIEMEEQLERERIEAEQNANNPQEEGTAGQSNQSKAPDKEGTHSAAVEALQQFMKKKP